MGSSVTKNPTYSKKISPMTNISQISNKLIQIQRPIDIGEQCLIDISEQRYDRLEKFISEGNDIWKVLLRRDSIDHLYVKSNTLGFRIACMTKIPHELLEILVVIEKSYLNVDIGRFLETMIMEMREPGQWEHVKHFIKIIKPRDICNYRNKANESIMHLILDTNRDVGDHAIEIANYLEKIGFDFMCKDRNGRTISFIAVKNLNIKMLRWLVSKGYNMTEKHLYTGRRYAISDLFEWIFYREMFEESKLSRCFEVIKYCLDNGANINYENISGFSLKDYIERHVSNIEETYPHHYKNFCSLVMQK